MNGSISVTNLVFKMKDKVPIWLGMELKIIE